MPAPQEIAGHCRTLQKKELHLKQEEEPGASRELPPNRGGYAGEAGSYGTQGAIRLTVSTNAFEARSEIGHVPARLAAVPISA